jgi:hypothetical protein
LRRNVNLGDKALCARRDRGGSVLRLSWPVVTPDLRLHLRYWDNIRINLVEIGRTK